MGNYSEQEIELKIKTIEKSFIGELINNGLEISDDAVCNINTNSIELGIKATGKYAEKGYKMAFSSQIDLYSKEHSIIGKKHNEINFGTSGSFTPSNRESFWRTIHAASVLKNWEKVCEIVDKYCEMYKVLIKD